MRDCVVEKAREREEGRENAPFQRLQAPTPGFRLPSRLVDQVPVLLMLPYILPLAREDTAILLATEDLRSLLLRRRTVSSPRTLSTSASASPFSTSTAATARREGGRGREFGGRDVGGRKGVAVRGRLRVLGLLIVVLRGVVKLGGGRGVRKGRGLVLVGMGRRVERRRVGGLRRRRREVVRLLRLAEMEGLTVVQGRSVGSLRRWVAPSRSSVRKLMRVTGHGVTILVRGRWRIGCLRML